MNVMQWYNKQASTETFEGFVNAVDELMRKVNDLVREKEDIESLIMNAGSTDDLFALRSNIREHQNKVNDEVLVPFHNAIEDVQELLNGNLGTLLWDSVDKLKKK